MPDGSTRPRCRALRVRRTTCRGCTARAGDRRRTRAPCGSSGAPAFSWPFSWYSRPRFTCASALFGSSAIARRYASGARSGSTSSRSSPRLYQSSLSSSAVAGSLSALRRSSAATLPASSLTAKFRWPCPDSAFHIELSSRTTTLLPSATDAHGRQRFHRGEFGLQLQQHAIRAPRRHLRVEQIPSRCAATRHPETRTDIHRARRAPASADPAARSDVPDRR